MLFVGAVLVVGVRLFYLQIRRGDHYTEMVREKLRQRPRWVETVRGRIFDCRGRVLAEDRPRFDVCLQYDLVRLYDERFWRYRLAQLYDKLPPGGRRGSRAEFVAEHTGQEGGDIERVSAALGGLIGGDKSGDDRADAKIEALRNELSRRKRTDALLTQVGRICQASESDIRQALQAVNDRFYDKQLARARRQWYTEQGLTFRSEPGAEARGQDFAEKVPDEIERICAIYSMNDIAEMRRGQVIVADISEDAALIVGERIVGAFLGGGGRDRPVFIRATKDRIYPYGDAACHLLGQMGPLLDESDLTAWDIESPTLTMLEGYRVGDRRGDWGVEHMFEPWLRGRRGWVRYRRAEEGPDPERIESLPGGDVTLTIDIEFQRAIQYLFEQRQRRGAAVVIEVETGHILAAVSVPTFDLNTFYQAEQYNKIVLKSPNEYWVNRALSKGYQPGSTIKPTIVLGALENGVINGATEHDCHADNVDWRSGPKHIYGHGSVRADDAIRVSCNYYCARVGQAMGGQRLQEWLRQAGFGQPLLAWPPGGYEERVAKAFSETPGTIHRGGRPRLSRGELLFLSVGLAPFTASVVQMANGAATVARDGRWRQPTLIAEPVAAAAQRLIAASSGWVRLTRRGMSEVVYARSGTGYQAFNPPPWPREQVELFGKTGTTENSVFICGAQADDGRCIVVAVVVEIRASGGEDGAQMARAILELCEEEGFGYLPEAIAVDHNIL